MRRFLLLAVIIAVIIVVPFFVSENRVAWLIGIARNYYVALDFPTAKTTIERADGTNSIGWRASAEDAIVSPEEWPSFNRTLTSERYSRLGAINVATARELKVLCIYDTKQYASFQSGLVMVNGALIGTTGHDIFSIDAATCQENWRTHENYKPASALSVNRGAAYLDGRLFRGTQDGRVLAYDFKTGRRLWATVIADPDLGETVPAAPIAWNGLIFVGNAGGDYKGVKGRMYALAAGTGDIVWEAYLVPKAASDKSRGPAAPPPPTAAAKVGPRFEGRGPQLEVHHGDWPSRDAQGNDIRRTGTDHGTV